MKYKKEIRVNSADMVCARIMDSDGRSIGSKRFFTFFGTNKEIERKCRKAHEWADDRIALCIRQEV